MPKLWSGNVTIEEKDEYINMKKFMLIIMIVISSFFVGCDSNTPHTQYVRPEEPHLYWKDIEVIVTDVETCRWVTKTHWCYVYITVESKEYDLSKTLEFEGSGFFGKPSQWDYQVGDKVTAQLYSWVKDSTGEIVRREIYTIY